MVWFAGHCCFHYNVCNHFSVLFDFVKSLFCFILLLLLFCLKRKKNQFYVLLFFVCEHINLRVHLIGLLFFIPFLWNMYLPSCQALQKWISENFRMEGLARRVLNLLRAETYWKVHVSSVHILHLITFVLTKVWCAFSLFIDVTVCHVLMKVKIARHEINLKGNVTLNTME